MRHLGTKALGALTLCALAACGGSSTSPTVSYQSLTTSAATLQDKYTDANGDLLAGMAPAASADINAAPNATYTGYVSGVVGGSDLVGTLSVDADFAAKTTTATAEDFFHATDGAYTGTLTGTGNIQPSAPAGTAQMSTTLNGDLTNGGTVYTTALALNGDFVAAGGDAVGAIAGTADGTLNAALLTGAFAAEK